MVDGLSEWVSSIAAYLTVIELGYRAGKYIYKKLKPKNKKSFKKKHKRKRKK